MESETRGMDAFYEVQADTYASPPDITHVIPAHNEEAFLPRTLESVKRAAAAFGGRVEVIVVDNESTDRTAEIARWHGARVVRETVRRIAAVRNAGGLAARGRIVSFADADSMISENFFIRVAELMASGQYVGGNFGIRPDRSSLGIRLTIWFIMAVIRLLLRVGGGSYFCLRETFQAVGGFDTSLPYGEDVAFGRALRQYGKPRGLRYVQDFSAHVVTSMRKADALGDWFAIRFILLLPLRVFVPWRLHRKLHEHFYEFDRSRPSEGFK